MTGGVESAYPSGASILEYPKIFVGCVLLSLQFILLCFMNCCFSVGILSFFDRLYVTFGIFGLYFISVIIAGLKKRTFKKTKFLILMLKPYFFSLYTNKLGSPSKSNLKN